MRVDFITGAPGSLVGSQWPDSRKATVHAYPAVQARTASDVAIRIDCLTKRFGAIVAVDDLSLTVTSGEVFGFLGPNGAGKSTTIRMLLGLIRPSAGSAHVFGVPASDVRRAHRHLAYVPADLVLDEPTSGLDPLVEREFRRCVMEARKREFAAPVSRIRLAVVEIVVTVVGLFSPARDCSTCHLGRRRHHRRPADSRGRTGGGVEHGTDCMACGWRRKPCHRVAAVSCRSHRGPTGRGWVPADCHHSGHWAGVAALIVIGSVMTILGLAGYTRRDLTT